MSIEQLIGLAIIIYQLFLQEVCESRTFSPHSLSNEWILLYFMISWCVLNTPIIPPSFCFEWSTHICTQLQNSYSANCSKFKCSTSWLTHIKLYPPSKLINMYQPHFLLSVSVPNLTHIKLYPPSTLININMYLNRIFFYQYQSWLSHVDLSARWYCRVQRWKSAQEVCWCMLMLAFLRCRTVWFRV